MNKLVSFLIKSVCVCGMLIGGEYCAHATANNSIDLSGDWDVSLLQNGIGGKIQMPTTLDIAGYGELTDTVGISVDERFRRLTRRRSYIGSARYTKRVKITEEMANRPLELFLERVIWKSKARIGGLDFDNEEYSLVGPHRHTLASGLPAGEYTLEVEVDNSRQFDISTSNLAHCYTNDTQTMWNGILGDIYLRALPDCDLRRVEVYPTEALDSVYVDIYVDNTTHKARQEKILVGLGKKTVRLKERLYPGINRLRVGVPVDGLDKWNEFQPAVNEINVGVGKEIKKVKFGLRTVDNKDGLRVNGMPVFLRGTLECCVFPLTGAPAMDKEGWLKTFDAARRWGLNHLRFHSWCPPEAAFEVADSLGFYLQVELPVWSLKIGDDANAESFLREEFERIVENYGNHPSLCLISVGNELQHDFGWLNETVALMKRRDPRRLYTTTSFTFEKGHGGHPEPEDEFMVTQWTDKGWVRGQGVFETELPAFDKNYDASLDGIGIPLISHEIGQYAVYPRISEISKYTGVLNPLNFKYIKKDLDSKGMLSDSERMTQASGNLAAILYKEEIERALKTKGMSGYQLLGLQDFPGQGTALVGLVDAFWDNKGAVTEEWFREFCAPVVPLLDFKSAVYRSGEVFEGEVSVANYSDKMLDGQKFFWTLTDDSDEKVLAQGELVSENIGQGKVGKVGKFEVSLADISTPSAVTVRVRMESGASNSWRIHVYPDRKVDHGKVLLTRSTKDAIEALNEGRDVLLAPPVDSISGLESKFLPVFWSPVHFPKQAGTMGIMCDAEHPALMGFPNNGYSDWQWWGVARNAKVVNMDSIPDAGRIVSLIDNFVHNRKLAYIFEARVGKGKLLFSAVDILNPDNNLPELNALRNSLIEYMNTQSFNPQGVISEKSLRDLTTPTKPTESTTATSIYE